MTRALLRQSLSSLLLASRRSFAALTSSAALSCATALFAPASAALAGFSLIGCAPKTEAAPVAVAPVQKVPELHQFLPLKDRTVSNFEMETDLGDNGIVVLEIFRPREELAELKIAGRVQRLHIEERRISQATGGILLEAPLKTGHSFVGHFGKVTITEVNQLIEVPAGTYTGCLTTVEESTDPPKRATSTYCPGVGLVGMTVESFGEGAGLVKTRLKYHGPRFEASGPRTSPQ